MNKHSSSQQVFAKEHLIHSTGLLLVNKNEGPTSHQIVDMARKALNIRKIGHCGTLDPFASGLLILLIGEATRLQQYFFQMNKTYEAVFNFGETTDTLDPTGTSEHVNKQFALPELETIEKLIDRHFLGVIEQVPPKYSAIKVNGKRAYKLSREKKDFELKAREVTVHKFDIEKISPRTIKVYIECSSGTYVRALARDLGKALGTHGMLQSLVRTQIERFSIKNALTPDQLTPANKTLHQAILSVHNYIEPSHHIELDEKSFNMLKGGKLPALLKWKKSNSRNNLSMLSPDERQTLSASYQLLFFNNLLVGIWERERNTLIYNVAKYL
ncbi:tRNA pseudouridine synthase B [Spirochaetota bacterium]|nr:tRNA pseudouridine synthase B [Spirochaetota bacterium]